MASAQVGAYTMGSDIDFKLLHGLGINSFHQRILPCLFAIDFFLVKYFRIWQKFQQVYLFDM